MPVVVTAADRPLGRALVEALVAAVSQEMSEEMPEAARPDIRATVRDPAAAAELIAMGVRTAVCDLVDPRRFGAVLEGAHTVVHLDDPTVTWELLLDAAADTGLRRIVTVLGPDDDVPAAQPYELVLIRTADLAPRPELVAALLHADDRREVPAGTPAVEEVHT